MQTVLRILDLSKAFKDKQVLYALNFEVKRGDIVGYIGPNGSGKSTTVKLIMGLLKDYRGSIEVFGQDISQHPIEYKRRIGYVPEAVELYESLTPKEYLSFLSKVYEMQEKGFLERSHQMLDIFGIGDCFEQRIASFSKGMKQKLAIVCSMVHNPDLLFLDEPLNGLDANSVAIFKEVMDSLAKSGKTIFYSSHIMEVVQKISTRIILLKNGRILANGTIDELMQGDEDVSLEEVFNQLTGFEKKHSLADQFVDSVLGEANHE